MKNSDNNIRNRTRDLPDCSAVSEATAPPRAPLYGTEIQNKTTKPSTPPLPHDDSRAYNWRGPSNEAAADCLEALERCAEGNEERSGLEPGTSQL